MASTLKQTESKEPSFTGSEINAGSKKENRILWSRMAGLDDLFRQLDALTESEDYNDDFLSPTESATSRVRELLTRAGASLNAAFPAGTIYADGDGGLRLEWTRPERELRFVVSASPQGRSYIYHEQRDEYAVDYSPTAGELGKWLNWLALPAGHDPLDSIVGIFKDSPELDALMERIHEEQRQGIEQFRLEAEAEEAVEQAEALQR